MEKTERISREKIELGAKKINMAYLKNMSFQSTALLTSALLCYNMILKCHRRWKTSILCLDRHTHLNTEEFKKY